MSPLLWLFLGYVSLVGVLFLVRPTWLFALWPVVLLVLPTQRTFVGPAPVYWFDLATAAVLAAGIRFGAFRWPRAIPPWHWILGGILAFAGIVTPVLLYGFSPEIVWLWAHGLLAWMVFPIALRLPQLPRGEGAMVKLSTGLAVALLGLLVIAFSQQYSSAADEFLRRYYYEEQAERAGSGQLGQSIAIVSEEGEATRVIGPFQASTTFAGVAAVAGLASLWLTSPKRRLIPVVGFLASLGVVAMTFSRQAPVALGMGTLAVLVFGTVGQRAKAFMLVFAVLVFVVAIGLGSFWSARFNRLSEGVLQDENLRARLIEGPTRITDVWEDHPFTIITGLGMEPVPLWRYGEGASFAAFGLASNGFLLAFSCWGVAGFLIFGSLWGWTFLRAMRLPKVARGVGAGIVVACTVLTAADNYSFFNETAIALLMLCAGLVAGMSFRPTERSQLPAVPGVLESPGAATPVAPLKR